MTQSPATATARLASRADSAHDSSAALRAGGADAENADAVGGKPTASTATESLEDSMCDRRFTASAAEVQCPSFVQREDVAEAASRRRCAAEEARLALRVAAGGFAGEVKRGGR